jgi:carbon-monoxide dehydrogenase small subunit
MPSSPQNGRLEIAVEVNGERMRRHVEVRKNLADFLRDDLGLTGTHVGCEHGVCGACTVKLNGRSARACLTLAVQADGGVVETIEGLTRSASISDLQAAFVALNAAQCGFCTSGMLVTASELLEQQVVLSREAIREFISGNICRCTGYHAIVDAIEQTMHSRAAR